MWFRKQTAESCSTIRAVESLENITFVRDSSTGTKPDTPLLYLSTTIIDKTYDTKPKSPLFSQAMLSERAKDQTSNISIPAILFGGGGFVIAL